jgi:long-chain acyl-CoA synthetase
MVFEAGRTILSLYYHSQLRFPDRPAFFYGPPDFKKTLSFQEIWTQARHQAKRLKMAGVIPGDRIGIWASSSIRWEIAQLAILMCEGVVVGLDINESENNLVRIQSITNLKLLLVEQNYLINRWNKLFDLPIRKCPLVEEYSDILDETEINLFQNVDTEAFIFFTSGTTSESKAISYSSAKVILAINEIINLYPEASDSPKTICWLPLSNLFQRVVNFCTVAQQGEIYFVENPVDVVIHLRTIEPSLFISVPRFYEKIFDTFYSKISRLPGPVSVIMNFGIWLSIFRWNNRKNPVLDKLLKILITPWDRLLFSKIRGVFGKNLKILISGSAPIRRELQVFFHSIQLPLLEAYGASENTIPIAANTLTHFKIGSVGKPVISNSVIISSDGEVLVKTLGLFTGYLEMDSTASFENGYYKTGDLGHLDYDGFLFLDGRKTEMFKTTTGKKVAVAEIETNFKTLPFVDQIVVIGEGRKFPLVLLTVDFNNLATHFNRSLSEIWSVETGTIAPEILKNVEDGIRDVWKSMFTSVKPMGALVLTRRLTIDKNEVTLNLKIRRKHIELQFQKYFDKLNMELEKKIEFPILFIGSEGEVVGANVKSSSVARLFRVILLVSKLISLRVLFTLGFFNESAFHRSIGQFLRVGLGGLKGPMQKLGQILSTLPDALPLEVKEELDQLFYQSHPVNSHLIKSIVEKDLKKTIPSLFAEWKDFPISTGSVGQVHWARLHSGQEVAVKVLLPGIERALKSDLKVLGLLIPLLKKLIKIGSLPEHFIELERMMIEETDLTKEADYYLDFSEIFKIVQI